MDQPSVPPSDASTLRKSTSSPSSSSTQQGGMPHPRLTPPSSVHQLSFRPSVLPPSEPYGETMCRVSRSALWAERDEALKPRREMATMGIVWKDPALRPKLRRLRQRRQRKGI